MELLAGGSKEKLESEEEDRSKFHARHCILCQPVSKEA